MIRITCDACYKSITQGNPVSDEFQTDAFSDVCAKCRDRIDKLLDEYSDEVRNLKMAGRQRVVSSAVQSLQSLNWNESRKVKANH